MDLSFPGISSLALFIIPGLASIPQYMHGLRFYTRLT